MPLFFLELHHLLHGSAFHVACAPKALSNSDAPEPASLLRLFCKTSIGSYKRMFVSGPIH
jgi:hypothetical protein